MYSDAAELTSAVRRTDEGTVEVFYDGLWATLWHEPDCDGRVLYRFHDTPWITRQHDIVIEDEDDLLEAASEYYADLAALDADELVVDCANPNCCKLTTGPECDKEARGNGYD